MDTSAFCSCPPGGLQEVLNGHTNSTEAPNGEDFWQENLRQSTDVTSSAHVECVSFGLCASQRVSLTFSGRMIHLS